MDFKVERKRLNTLTEKTTWKVIISSITTLERNIPMKIFYKLSGGFQSLEGEKKFSFMIICIL